MHISFDQLPQLPKGWFLTQAQALPRQRWLKQPHKFHPPRLLCAQSHSAYDFCGFWFMKGIKYPSSNSANFALAPKQPLQSASPAAKLTIAEPCTGSVTSNMPPVQPSQQPPSVTLKGVNSMAILQEGRTMLRALVMQSTGSVRLQGVSPSKGLQLLQEKRPAQLFSQEGKTVACKVSPFLMGTTQFCSDCAAVPRISSRARNSLTLVIDKYNNPQKNTADFQILIILLQCWLKKKYITLLRCFFFVMIYFYNRLFRL